jgi:hypothetical protein
VADDHRADLRPRDRVAFRHRHRLTLPTANHPVEGPGATSDMAS